MAHSVELLTISYRGDFDACTVLCDSVDRFVPESVAHRLVIPRADMAIFEPLVTRRRRLVAEEDLLPAWFVRAPMPPPRWRKFLHLPRRDIYLTPFSLPVRGWIAQQIMKIAASLESSADIVVHLDSDTAFIRPFPFEQVSREGHVHIYRDPKSTGHASHTLWQEAAGRLLGLPPRSYYGGEYIGSFIVWKTSVVRGLVERLEKISGHSWITTLARTPHFSEYVLYGVYADHVLGFKTAKLAPSSVPLCHSRWSGEFVDAQDVDAFVASVKPEHVLCHVQSTLSEGLESRRQIFECVTNAAASQDMETNR